MSRKFDKVPLSLPLLPAHLAHLGFKPHMVGKWHLGHYKAEFTPTRQVSMMLAMTMILVVEICFCLLRLLDANPTNVEHKEREVLTDVKLNRNQCLKLIQYFPYF